MIQFFTFVQFSPFGFFISKTFDNGCVILLPDSGTGAVYFSSALFHGLSFHEGLTNFLESGDRLVFKNGVVHCLEEGLRVWCCIFGLGIGMY